MKPGTKALLASLLFAASASPALAHAFLKSSVPAVGSTVAAAPRFLLLTFTEDLEVPFCTVSVSEPAGNAAAGKPQAVPGHADQLKVPLKITKPGRIEVSWHALSVDTHKTQGKFSFTIGQ